jgi:cytochrome c5
VEEQTDKTFTKNVSIVLAILVVFTFIIYFIAKDLGSKDESANNPSRMTTTEDRIQPVAAAYTGEAGAAAIEEAATASVEVQTVAFDGSLDGEMIYNSVCGTCHATGLAGAPQPGTPAMADRAAKGTDALVQTALDGLNAMPARGGRSDLSDDQIKAVVEFMLQ